MQNISFSIDDFLSLTSHDFLGRMSRHHSLNHVELTSTQTFAWEREFNDLQNILKGKTGRIIFEYSIPGLPKVIDVVLLLEGTIFILEYKVNSTTYNEIDKRQTNGYALRLKFFHSKSNDNWIIPILVATDAPTSKLEYNRSEEDMVYEVIMCNSSNLGTAINDVLEIESCDVDQTWENEWENGIYKASPTIIDAARNVWKQNNVRGFTISEAAEETRLAAENYIINTVIEETRNRPKGQNKSICFVTGVPGAGKTLVGLNLSVRLQDVGASMLSGNDPLVKVLTEALKRDLKNNRNNLVKPRDEISVDSIVRSAFGYKKEIFEKRLDYFVGTGSVALKENAEMGSLHVIIFDEAQRAWDRAKMVKPGQNGRKYWQEKAFPFSEPGLLLWDMNTRDWGVFVCLVGGGQEINTGEAGICEWLHALKYNPELSDWHVYMSEELSDNVYNSKSDSETLDSYRLFFQKQNRLTVNESLHLTACQRSLRSELVSDFVENILDCNVEEARKYYSLIKDKYHIYVTRDVELAKNKLRERKTQLLDRGYINGNNMDEEIRIGILMSSRAVRLRPLGFETKTVSNYLDKVHKWFLDPSENVNSSDFLEVALTEFLVQGLELDLSAVFWDADFRYNKQHNNWDYYVFKDSVWKPVDDTKKLVQFYMMNAYRVLLTRARSGMVIIVPKGSLIDSTRDPSYYDCTYNYLKEIGIEEILQ